MRVHAVLRLVAGHPRCRCSSSCTHCGERFSGCDWPPQRGEGHTAASVGCASLSLHRSLLTLAQAVGRNEAAQPAHASPPSSAATGPNVDKSIEAAAGYPVGVAACAWGSGRQSASAARLFIHDSARPPTPRVGAGSRHDPVKTGAETGAWSGSAATLSRSTTSASARIAWLLTDSSARNPTACQVRTPRTRQLLDSRSIDQRPPEAGTSSRVGYSCRSAPAMPISTSWMSCAP